MNRSTILTAVLLLSTTNPPLAEETGEAAAAPVENLTVIANKSSRALAEVPATVSVLGRTELDRQMTRDIKDLVRYEPGVTVTSDAQRFGLGSYNIRGVDGNRVAIELDGVPVPQSFSVGSFASATRDWVDPDTLKRVEILRGPSSTLYGSSALGGVVTYSTRDPADFIGPGEHTAGLWSKASGNSIDDSTLLSAALAGRSGSWEGMLLASGRRGSETDNNADSDEYVANPADTSGANFLGKALYNFSPVNRVRLTVEESSSDVDTDVQSLVGAPGRYANTVAMQGVDTYERRRISLDQDWEVGGVYVDRLRWSAFTQDSDTLQETWQEQVPAGRVTYPSLRYRSFDMQDATDGAEVILESSFDTDHGQHRLVYGVEWVQVRIEELRDGLETNLDTGDSTNVIIGEELPVRDFPVSTSRQLGLFLQDEITIADGRMALVPGLRYERFDMQPEADSMFEEDNPGIEPVSINESNTSPRLGLTAALTSKTSAYLQYAEGFRAPPMEDVNIGFTIPAFNFVALPNPDLKPETSRGYEAGLRYQGDGLSYSVSVFNNEYENLIESRANMGVDPDTGILVFQSVNRASATINGAELRATLAAGPGRSALEGWRVDLGLAYARGTDTDRNQPLNSITPLTAVVGLGYVPAQGRWGVQLTNTLVASQDRVDNTAGELFQPPGYGLLDLTAFIHFGSRLSLQAGIFNIGDKKYWEWGNLHGLAATDPAADFFTAPGRNASLSLIYAFSR
ncbi:MAG: TonB-dependent hemoglobin/transferrin/lactoferrin family receptor [Gammaproteobacteria bacterium]|jgi:hemoglobin/transferrin/lactoferrin receptor protein|nr:TonB-dependent hemoglobin/transferrin/lactoferrin family receptor [Gammaproteobacteria bacterium]